MSEKVLVTGAAGFIGYHLCSRLLSMGYVVVGIDSLNDYYSPRLKMMRLSMLGIPPEAEQWNRPVTSQDGGMTFIRMNLHDREALPRLFAAEAFSLVVNLAAQAGVRYSLENPFAYIDSNIVGFANILECCRHYPVRHLVYASSSSVYGASRSVPFRESDRVDRPVSLYAATKKSDELMAECYSHLYGIPSTGLRFFTVYGPWGRPDMAPMLFADAIMSSRPIKVFNSGDMMRDFTYIDDIIEGVVRVLAVPPQTADGSAHRVLNIGCGSPVILSDFISVMERNLGRTAVREMLPMQPGDVPATWADTAMLSKTVSYSPTTPVEKGVAEFVRWYAEYRDLIG